MKKSRGFTLDKVVVKELVNHVTHKMNKNNIATRSLYVQSQTIQR